MNNNVLQVLFDDGTEFYPTPQSLVEKMLDGVDFRYIHTILEPSAGKGDILRVLATKEDRYSYGSFDVDCIEIDPNLRAILKYNFSEERKNPLLRRKEELRETSYWNGKTYVTNELTAQQKMEKLQVERELETFFKDGIHIIHDDFLTYNPFKRYDLIIMNPPFSNGDKHLLKALRMQEKGGNIICLLNAETIRNPYTESRKELVKQLNKHNAIIEYIQNAFVSAERKTGVEIALIKVAIEEVQEESDIYNRLKEAEQMEEIYADVTDLEVTDMVKALVNQFNIEVKAGIELIRQYKALQPYIRTTFDEKSSSSLTLKVGDKGNLSVNGYVKQVRYKYWYALLSNNKFVGKLTSKLRQEYMERVSKLKNYDFSEFNIYTLSAEMNAQVKTGIENEIVAMFDRLTAEHSWYKECSNNRHYYDGWQTNKAHKIGKKVIIPCYGVFGEWDGRPRTYQAKNTLEDIERILNFLDGGMTREVNLYDKLNVYFECGETKNIELKYFKATFYKKGTVHLVFTCPELIERFNIYAAQNKNWLPPSYGKTRYKDMTAEEKAVVDSFQGEQAYNNVMAKARYFLAPVVNNQLLRIEG